MMTKNNSLTTANVMFALLLSSLFLAAPALAAGGGLDKGTNFIKDIRIWGYAFVGVVALCHILWSVFKAYMEMDSWSGVVKSLIYAAIAGGCVAAAEAAYQIWGS